MQQYVLALLKSKRTWVIIITALAHVLAKHHIIISDSAVSDIADQAILIAGSVGVVGTKILDARKAAAPPASPAQ